MLFEIFAHKILDIIQKEESWNVDEHLNDITF
jgi:hypothetical protein